MDDNITAGERRQTQRVASLDIFRGLTVALMILVDEAGGEWPAIAHVPWHGCNLADFMMPFFLFIVGMAIPLALKRVASGRQAVRKVIFRTLKLFFLGLLIQGGFSHAPDKLTCEVDVKINRFSGILQRIVFGVDMKTIRICGILQRIAFSYLLVAVLEIFLKDAASMVRSHGQLLSHGHFSVFKSYCWQWAMGVVSLIVYFGFVYGISVPDWHFTIDNKDSADYGKVFTVTCGVRGKLNLPCNAVGLIDRKVLGINHMYQHPAWRRSKACTENSPYEGPLRKDAPSWCHAPFEPEGILSSISSLLSTIIGAHFGHVLIYLKGHSDRLKHWVIMGLFLLLLGLILHFTHAIPLNKQLYTFSYVCLTSGTAALVFSTIYILVDIRNMKHVFLPFKWIGMNALLVYVLAAEGIFAAFINGWYYGCRHNTLIYWIRRHIFIGVWHSQRVGVLLYVLFAEILFWAVVSGILHWLGIYWKL